MAITQVAVLDKDNVKMRYAEPYVSDGVNKKFVGTISPGLYRGFVITQNLASILQVIIKKDVTYNDNVAVVSDGIRQYNIVVDGDMTWTIPNVFLGRVALLVINVDFFAGTNTELKIYAYDRDTDYLPLSDVDKNKLCVLGEIDLSTMLIPAAITSAMIGFNYKTYPHLMRSDGQKRFVKVSMNSQNEHTFNDGASVLVSPQAYLRGAGADREYAVSTTSKQFKFERVIRANGATINRYLTFVDWIPVRSGMSLILDALVGLDNITFNGANPTQRIGFNVLWYTAANASVVVQEDVRNIHTLAPIPITAFKYTFKAPVNAEYASMSFCILGANGNSEITIDKCDVFVESMNTTDDELNYGAMPVIARSPFTVRPMATCVFNRYFQEVFGILPGVSNKQESVVFTLSPSLLPGQDLLFTMLPETNTNVVSFLVNFTGNVAFASNLDQYFTSGKGVYFVGQENIEFDSNDNVEINADDDIQLNADDDIKLNAGDSIELNSGADAADFVKIDKILLNNYIRMISDAIGGERRLRIYTHNGAAQIERWRFGNDITAGGSYFIIGGDNGVDIGIGVVDFAELWLGRRNVDMGIRCDNLGGIRMVVKHGVNDVATIDDDGIEIGCNGPAHYTYNASNPSVESLIVDASEINTKYGSTFGGLFLDLGGPVGPNQLKCAIGGTNEYGLGKVNFHHGKGIIVISSIKIYAYFYNAASNDIELVIGFWRKRHGTVAIIETIAQLGIDNNPMGLNNAIVGNNEYIIPITGTGVVDFDNGDYVDILIKINNNSANIDNVIFYTAKIEYEVTTV